MFDKDYLIELRIANKLTQRQLAKKIGVHRNQITYWEQGTHIPNFKNIEKLSKFFKVAIEKFLKQ